MLIVPVVEGVGDAVALPRLLQRILHERIQRSNVQIAAGKQNVVTAKDSGQLRTNLTKYLLHAERKPGCGGILVLMDTDDKHCPVELAHHLRSQAITSGVNKPVQVVCAHQEYEAWFLASLKTIRGNLHIDPGAELEMPVEVQGNPKGWISRKMPRDRSYKPTSHQLALTELVDLELAHTNSRSFRRLCHALELLAA